MQTSRLPGFYALSVPERAAQVAEWAGLNDAEREALAGGLAQERADKMIENVVGLHALPLAVAPNFLVNGRDYLVPMAIEEPSVVAAASFMARVVRDAGGFLATSTEPVMIGQIQVLDVSDLPAAQSSLLREKGRLLELATRTDPVVASLGGGARDIEVRLFAESPAGPMLVLHLLYDVRDIMGANTVNTAVEALAPVVEEITGGRAHLRILSNLADRRLARASCTVPAGLLAFDTFSGGQVAQGIVEAYAFAAVDPYRAATHNKGIMNGIDAVVIATGNDWRSVEAGAHAYAARSGHYTSLSLWEKTKNGNLHGTLELPLAVGITGGSTQAHPTARANLKLVGAKSSGELAGIIASVGLAQNLAALRALATEGIQRGHMRLHARQVALSAGAEPAQVAPLAEQLVREDNIRIERAQEILREWSE